MTEPQKLQLAVGDRVVYPNQGVCRVSGVEVKEIAGSKLTFISMKREEDGALVMVPEAKVVAIGVRKIATPAESDRVFAFLKSDSDKADLDWKQRARTNVERMSAGGIVGLAEVVKGLAVLSELRPLPTKERELYDNARHLLVREVAASLDLTECDAEDSVDIVLFPPGKERPKRTAEEFAPRGEDEENLGIDEDLLSLGGDLDLPSDEEPAPAEEEESAEAGDEGDEGDEEAPAAKKPAAPKKAPKIELSDDEATQPLGTALVEEDALPPKRKRGRPPKPKPAVDPSVPPPAPKKRGRPPKPKPAEAPPAIPKKRGRPPKPKDGPASKPASSKKK